MKILLKTFLIGALFFALPALAAEFESVDGVNSSEFIGPQNFASDISSLGNFEGQNLESAALKQDSKADISEGIPVERLQGKIAASAAVEQTPWQESSFQSVDDARIHYRFRPGKGPAIVFVHGRAVAGVGYDQWMQAFPGRAMLILDRRGYGSSEIGSMTMDNLRELNGADIQKVLDIAGALGGDGRAAIVTLSLGSMILPEALQAKQVAWVALLNPGVFGMVQDMDMQTASLSWTLINTYAASQYWLPAARQTWINWTADYMIENLCDRLKAQSGENGFGDSLANHIRQEGQSAAYNETIIEEAVWSLSTSGSLKIDPRIPVFLGTSQSDEVVPEPASSRLLQNLKANGSSVHTVEWSGGHLTPLLEPARAIEALEAFDQDAAQAR